MVKYIKIVSVLLLTCTVFIFSCKQDTKKLNQQYLPGVTHLIRIDSAQSMVERYKLYQDSIIAGRFAGRQDILMNCEVFNRSAFDDILALYSCVGVRMYYGMQVNKKVIQIAVGVKPDGGDLYTDSLGIRCVPGSNCTPYGREMGQTCDAICCIKPNTPLPTLFKNILLPN